VTRCQSANKVMRNSVSITAFLQLMKLQSLCMLLRGCRVGRQEYYLNQLHNLQSLVGETRNRIAASKTRSSCCSGCTVDRNVISNAIYVSLLGSFSSTQSNSAISNVGLLYNIATGENGGIFFSGCIAERNIIPNVSY
jgi:hypothetical protein